MRIFSWLDKQFLLGLLLLICIDLIFSLFWFASPYFSDKSVSIFFKLFILFLQGVFIWLFWQTVKYVQFRIGKGIDGEYEVEKTLWKLPKSFLYSRDFVTGKKGNTDFIVVGPTGIWTIEVKNLKSGKITVNNDGLLCKDNFSINSETGKNVLSQAYAQAKSLQNFIRESLGLSLPVNSAIVFANRKTELHFGLNQVKGVYVIGVPFLLKLLQGGNIDERFTPEQCVILRKEIKKYTPLI